MEVKQLTARQKGLIYQALKMQSDRKEIFDDAPLWKETIELQQIVYNADAVLLIGK